MPLHGGDGGKLMKLNFTNEKFNEYSLKKGIEVRKKLDREDYFDTLLVGYALENAKLPIRIRENLFMHLDNDIEFFIEDIEEWVKALRPFSNKGMYSKHVKGLIAYLEAYKAKIKSFI